MEIFYKEVEGERKGQKTKLQTDQEFKQKKIFNLNKKFNVDMFLTAVRSRKAFAVEQELRKLKKKKYLGLKRWKKDRQKSQARRR